MEALAKARLSEMCFRYHYETAENRDETDRPTRIHLSKEKRRMLDLFEEILLEKNKSLNLTAARDLAAIRGDHTADSLALVPLIESSIKSERLERPLLVDVGSGAGFPAVPLAIALDGLEITCIESVAKKARALTEMLERIELGRISVLNDRAERLAHDPKWRGRADFGTARAVGHLATVAELILPFLKIGGVFFAQKGSYPSREIDESREAISALGGCLEDVRSVRFGEWPASHTIVRIQKIEPTIERYPRRVGVPAKRPMIGMTS